MEHTCCLDSIHTCFIHLQYLYSICPFCTSHQHSLPTIIIIVLMLLFHRFGYNHKVYYWVSEGPRLLIILVS